MRGVYSGDGPSSKVSATVRCGRAGPVGWNLDETGSCETTPRTITHRPGTRSTKNCGLAGTPPGSGTTVRLWPSLRSRPASSATRSPAKSRLRVVAGLPLTVKAPGKAPARSTLPLTSSRLPARGRRTMRAATAPSVVPGTIRTGRPSTVTVTVRRGFPPLRSKAATTTTAARTATIPIPRTTLRTSTTWADFAAGPTNLAAYGSAGSTMARCVRDVPAGRWERRIAARAGRARADRHSGKTSASAVPATASHSLLPGHRPRGCRRVCASIRSSTGSSVKPDRPRSSRKESHVTVREMLQAHPGAITLDRDLLLRCIDECVDCAAACTSCADADLGEPDVQELVRCVRLCLDCADACGATGRILIRQTEPDLGVLRAATEACAVACRACATSARSTRPTTSTAASAPRSAVAATRPASTWSQRSVVRGGRAFVKTLRPNPIPSVSRDRAENGPVPSKRLIRSP